MKLFKKKKEIYVEIPKMLEDNEYYKDIYEKVKKDIIQICDLSPDDFFMIMQMQNIEYEIVTIKLKEVIDLV